MTYLFAQGTFTENGTWTMPAWAVERWTKQCLTEYNKLSESDKLSDQKEANIFLDLLEVKTINQEIRIGDVPLTNAKTIGDITGNGENTRDASDVMDSYLKSVTDNLKSAGYNDDQIIEAWENMGEKYFSALRKK